MMGLFGPLGAMAGGAGAAGAAGMGAAAPAMGQAAMAGGMGQQAAGPASPMGTFNNPFTIGGILDDPSQLTQLNQNPLFNMGMGLLAHRADASVNPFGAALQGMQTAQQYQTVADKEKRMEEQREMLEDFFKSQRERMQSQTGGMRQSAVEQMLSPGVQRGLMANAIDPQNLELYNRLALREIMGQ